MIQQFEEMCNEGIGCIRMTDIGNLEVRSGSTDDGGVLKISFLGRRLMN